MIKSKLIRTILHTACALGLAGIMSAGSGIPAYAEGGTGTASTNGTDTELKPTITQDTADLTIRYFDDNEETIPASGAEFEVVQIATYGFGVEDNGRINYLDESLVIDNSGAEDEDAAETTADPEAEAAETSDAFAYEQKVLDAYSKNPGLGYRKTVTIGNDGTAEIGDLPIGSYLVRETKTIRYHKRSKPFVFSAPEMNEAGTSWNFEVVVNPKQILAGDLKITKEVKGKEATKNKSYVFKLTLADGYTYSADMGGGTTGTVKNGDEVSLKNGQTITIYDIPSGSEYEVVEEKANQHNEYDTTYKNSDGTRGKQSCSGTIETKDAVGATIINDSSSYDTGVKNLPIIWMMCGVGAAALLIILFATRRKDGKKEKKA